MTDSAETKEKREDFLIESFRFLEGKLQELRRYVMRRAAEIAKAESSPEDEIYTVTLEHVSRALSELLSNPEKCLEITGLKQV